ncbi:MAG: hypothetical protein HOM58_00740 [Rhodospirillaceae bacterium]|jgi:pimeloyl-ACP methyl ester carboxylesterase|nr:hypothetical protein [Rhodospirillaceae bacterium]MBT5459329.1 hypothetical protein [Rhodospirillaceae bacterium]
MHMVIIFGRRLCVFTATIAALIMTGCTSRTHYPGPTGIQSPPLVQVSHTQNDFTYKKQRTPVVSRVERDTDIFRILSFEMASHGDNGQAGNLVTARYYQSKAPGAKPLVIILPIWGVHTLPSNALTAQIRSQGGGSVNILQIHGWGMLFDMAKMAYAPNSNAFMSLLDQMIGRVVNTVIDIRRIVDWAETQPDIDRDRIALVGFSLSAMVASVALANEPRLGAGILAVGSASPHDSFATCGGSAGQMRKLVTNRFKWSTDQYRNKIKPPLARIDPARYPGRVDPRRILIIEAGEDTCLPAPARRQLWEVMGRPERIVYAYDHRATFMAMTFLGGGSLQKEAFRFLKKVFGMTLGG